MKIVCVSDLHENLIDIPECDLLLIAGDISYAFYGDLISKQEFLVGKFTDWLESVPAKEIVIVAGNHDQSIEQYGFPCALQYHYLQDSGIEIFGLKIWGTPWQPWFYNWAFNAPQRQGELFLAEKFAKIPNDTDIIIGHGPPLGFGDLPAPGQPGVGSSAMVDTIERVQPKLMVCGHIHSGYGQYQLGPTKIINASIVDNTYTQVNPPTVVEL